MPFKGYPKRIKVYQSAKVRFFFEMHKRQEHYEMKKGGDLHICRKVRTFVA